MFVHVSANVKDFLYVYLITCLVDVYFNTELFSCMEQRSSREANSFTPN
jgi:hypothetical protein